MIVDRKRLEKNEALVLAPYAISSEMSKGREYMERQDDERLAFQRDKDRIIHSKAFRRLNEKTQVFTAGTGDHYRTRLTHTLEVAQISRDLARKLALNEDLCEAIALAHDLGHPPYGHGGEDALNEVMQEFGMEFEHNQQSLRIVRSLEKLYPSFDGLNLTFETMEGMDKHQTAYDQHGRQIEKPPHLEAQIVNIADEIAYTNHDIDDGLRSGIITLGELRGIELWLKGEARVAKEYGKIDEEDILVSRIVSAIISLMVEDLCKNTTIMISDNGIESVDMVRDFPGVIAGFSDDMRRDLAKLRYFLYNNFYLNSQIVEVVARGQKMIKEMFHFYMKNPDKMTKKHFLRGEDPLAVQVKDYVAGMTDGFLTEEYSQNFGV